MIFHRPPIVHYLRASAGGFFSWAENNSVLVWRDGTTIAFREEILQIIEWLAPHGLPSFGAIVFLLAATRGKLPTVEDFLPPAKLPLPDTPESQTAFLLAARGQLRAQLEATLREFDKIGQLPTESLSGLKARCVLAEAVFEANKVERRVDGATVIRLLRDPSPDDPWIDSEPSAVQNRYLRQLHMVAEGLKRHTVESLTLRLNTGLDALPRGADVELPISERARRMIEELSRDPEHGAVGRAARELMAAVRLPRRLGERDELAVGGVADLTNRGPLDRLLLSELAHDDLTLSVRVALNEALYLRREPPVREPPGTLALLLDSGIRLWGVPRVLATAVALAIVARDKQHVQVLAFRPQGSQLRTVDLFSLSGLMQHLGALDVTAHPGTALAAFVEVTAKDSETQSVLITQRDVLDDPEFRRGLAACPPGLGFVATVERTGRFELHSLPLARKQPLCEADLDLAAILAEKTAPVPVISRTVAPDLPAIFGVHPFPFLLPICGPLTFWTQGGDGYIYALQADRRLVRFRDARKGGETLAVDLPNGKPLWMGWANNAVHIVKPGAGSRPSRLVSYSLDEQRLQVIDLVGDGELLAIHADGEVILAITKNDIRAYALDDRRLLSRTISLNKWVHGRFFKDTESFYFARWDGQTVRLEPLALGSSPTVVMRVFDRQGVEGPWFLNKGGQVISSVTKHRIQLPMPNGIAFGLDTCGISRNGHRVFIGLSNKNWGCLYNLQTDGRQIGWVDLMERFLDPLPASPSWNMYRVVGGIAPTPDGLALRGRRGQWRRIVLRTSDSARKCIRIEDLAFSPLDANEPLSFPEQAQRTPEGCTLQMIEWPDGTKAYLDSRGLLHLRSSDPSVPEVSLALAHNEVAGWTSNGHVCGPEFFFDGTRNSDPEAVFEVVQQILRGL